MPRLAQAEDRSVSRAVRRVILAVAIVLCLLLLLLWRIDSPRIERLRMAVADRLLPGIEVIGKPLDHLVAMTEDYRTYLDIYAENRKLRRENQRLLHWKERAQYLEEENSRLRALNNVRIPSKIKYVTADVVADSGGPFLQSALVSVGRRDNVTDGSAVIDGAGLVGRVVAVGERASRVLLLTDFSSRVPVIVRPSGRKAILAGDGTSAPKLEFLESPDGVNPGDQIVTTGDGNVFPPKLNVGRLAATPGGWRVVLAADYARLEFVRVLNYAPDTEIDQPGGLIVAPPPPEGPLVEGPAEGGLE